MSTMPPPISSSSPELGNTPPWAFCLGKHVLFPYKLYGMLLVAEQLGLTDVVSWLPRGLAFKIHDPDEFMSRVSSKFFTATKLRSIHRQLNLWGFQRIDKGVDKDSWFHESFQFQRGRPELLKNIICTKIKGKKNFYQMSPILLGQDEEEKDNASSGMDPQDDGAKSTETHSNRHKEFEKEGNRADVAMRAFLGGYTEASRAFLERSATLQREIESLSNKVGNLKARAKALEAENTKKQTASITEDDQMLTEMDSELDKLKSDHEQKLNDIKKDHEMSMKERVEELTYLIYQEKAEVFLRDGQIKDLREEIGRKQKEIDFLRMDKEQEGGKSDEERKKSPRSTEDTGKLGAEASGRGGAGNGGTDSRNSTMDERLAIVRAKIIVRFMEQQAKLNMSQSSVHQKQATNGEHRNKKMEQFAAALQMMASAGRENGARDAFGLIDTVREMNNSAQVPFFSMAQQQPQQQPQQHLNINNFQLNNGNNAQHNNNGNCFQQMNRY